MHFEISGHPTDPDAAWRAVADTDWMNREAGAGRMLAFEIHPDDAGYPEIHGALAGPLGMRLPFVEDENHWVRGREFRQHRTYTGGPLLASEYVARLEPSDSGVVPVIRLELTPRNALLSPVVRASLGQYRSRWARVLDGLPEPGLVPEPRVLRELGPVARQAWERWRRDVPEEIAEQVRQLLRTERPLALQQLRPFELADRWKLDRTEVTEALLSATVHGLLELYWSVRCPRCSAQTASTDHLGNLADHSSCSSCRIGFEADLTENVEVLFAPHPSLGDRVEESFCTLFPLRMPTVEASVILRPGDRWDPEVELQAGRWRLGPGGDLPDVEVEVGADGAEELQWSPDSQGPATVRRGPVKLHIENPTKARQRVQLTRLDAGAPVTPASYLTTLPGFRRQLGDQVLAPDIRVSARSVTLLFSDLTGSTAMYEELGDARAFALVRDHFRVLRSAIEAHHGTQVKTIGDAVMAAFHEPGQAMAAGLQMIRDFDLWIATEDLAHPPRLKLGVHVGPALVVHTDASGIDYFGRTVNLAARAQGVASGGELVFTEACAGWVEVGALLEREGLRPETLQADLKGLAEPVRLHRVRIGEADNP